MIVIDQFQLDRRLVCQQDAIRSDLEGNQALHGVKPGMRGAFSPAFSDEILTWLQFLVSCEEVVDRPEDSLRIWLCSICDALFHLGER